MVTLSPDAQSFTIPNMHLINYEARYKSASPADERSFTSSPSLLKIWLKWVFETYCRNASCRLKVQICRSLIHRHIASKPSRIILPSFLYHCCRLKACDSNADILQRWPYLRFLSILQQRQLSCLKRWTHTTHGKHARLSGSAWNAPAQSLQNCHSPRCSW